METLIEILALVTAALVGGVAVGIADRLRWLQTERDRLTAERDALQEKLDAVGPKRTSNHVIAAAENMSAPLAAAMEEIEALVTARDFLQVRVDSADRSLRVLHHMFGEYRNGKRK